MSDYRGIGRPTFPSAGFLREGYDRGAVDSFVEEVRRALKIDPPGMAPYEIVDARFKVVRRERGYSMREVDEYLDLAQRLLRERHGEDAVAGIAGSEPPARRSHTGVIYALALLVVAAIVIGVIVALTAGR